MDSFRTMVRVRIMALLFVFAGAIHAGVLGLFGVDLVSIAMFNSVPAVRLFYVLVAASVAFLAVRDEFLPFLGVSVYPCGALLEKTPYLYDTEISVKVAPNANVIFWAAEAASPVAANPIQAYSSYSNAGVTKSDATGHATLRVRRPAAYSVPLFGKLDPHVHYRVCERPGMLGPVQTAHV
jgi:uncharacterized membrane protein YuzA (DUF378 family)